MSLVIVKSFCLLFNGQKYNTSNIDINNNNTTSKPGHVCRINKNTHTYTHIIYTLHVSFSESFLNFLYILSILTITTRPWSSSSSSTMKLDSSNCKCKKRSNTAMSITLFSGIGINMKPDRQTGKQSKALLLPISIHQRKNTLKTQYSHYSKIKNNKKKQRNIKSIVFRWLNGMMKIIRKFSYS